MGLCLRRRLPQLLSDLRINVQIKQDRKRQNHDKRTCIRLSNGGNPVYTHISAHKRAWIPFSTKRSTSRGSYEIFMDNGVVK